MRKEIEETEKECIRDNTNGEIEKEITRRYKRERERERKKRDNTKCEIEKERERKFVVLKFFTLKVTSHFGRRCDEAKLRFGCQNFSFFFVSLNKFFFSPFRRKATKINLVQNLENLSN